MRELAQNLVFYVLVTCISVFAASVPRARASRFFSFCSYLKQARRFGADAAVSPVAIVNGEQSEDGAIQLRDSVADQVTGAVRKLTAEGVGIAFDTSGLQSTLDTAITLTMPGGMIFNVAMHEHPLQVNLTDLSLQEKRLTGGISYTTEDFEQVMELLTSPGFQAKMMITSIVPLANIIEGGFLDLIKNREEHVKILIQARKPGITGG